MKPSISNWFAVFGLDIAIRATYFLLTSLNPLEVMYAFFISVFHILILIVTSLLFRITASEWRHSFAASAALASLVFVIVIAVFRLWLIRSGMETSCFNNMCYWQKGVVNSSGMVFLAIGLTIQLLINIVTYFGAYRFSKN